MRDSRKSTHHLVVESVACAFFEAADELERMHNALPSTFDLMDLVSAAEGAHGAW